MISGQFKSVGFSESLWQRLATVQPIQEINKVLVMMTTIIPLYYRLLFLLGNTGYKAAKNYYFETSSGRFI